MIRPVKLTRTALSFFLATAAFTFIPSPLLATEPATDKRTITLDQRIAAAKAIEELYWRHRIWPESNPTPKPALSDVMSESVLRSKAEEPLRYTAALRRLWSYEISASDLMAEVERMKRGSKDPAVLHEVFAALGNDPMLIAECLARPTLTRRLLHNWFVNDDRIHGATRRIAEEDLATIGDDPARLATTRSEYREFRWVKRSALADPGESSGAAFVVDDDEFAEQLRWVDAAMAPASPGVAAAVTRVSVLQHGDDGYFALTVLDRSDSSLRVGVSTWRKQSFDAWWAQVRAASPMEEIPAMSYAPISESIAANEAASACTPDQWTPLAGVPEGRYRHSAVWTGTEMIIWGGSGLSSGARYNPATDTWTPINERGAPSARSGHTAVWTGQEMIVWGSDGANGTATPGGRYAPQSDSWQALPIAPIEDREHATAVWTGAEMIAWGGRYFISSGPTYVYGVSGARYSPTTNSWVLTSASDAPDTRAYHSAVWTGTTMIIFGGSRQSYYYSPADYFYDGREYSPNTDSWGPLISGPEYRDQHSAIWTGDEMIVWGGYNRFQGTLATGFRYNPVTRAISPTAISGAPSGRTGHTAVWTGTQMIVWGGSGQSGGRYSPASDSWRAVDSYQSPNGSSNHTAVWSGREMIVWGGGGGNNTGGRYDPGSDSWRPTSTDTPGVGRRDHSLTWTGTELVGWGGFTGSNSTSEGFRYTPSIDSWEPTTSENAPSPRYNHTAVWDGNQIFVWGGENPTRLRTGARYSPSTDSWTPSTLAGAPSARASHSAIWDGTRFIIWGGNGDQDLRTGARYLPYADTWSSTSLTNAPTARSSHTAIWTGAKMVIWGGDVYSNTGAQYDPSLDTWQPTSTINAPAARQKHTATWTGSDMIVWGGSNGPSSLNDGARYTPATDTWANTSQANAPAPRARHTAVWSGKTMIVWGGNDAGARVGTGSKYIPTTNTWQTIEEAHAPRARSDHRAVWTDDQMIVWGGYAPGPSGEEGYLNIGRAYCACSTSDLTCDGKDQDCNGLFDDGFVGGATTCGVGICQAAGNISCFDGIETNTCVPGSPALDDSLCNNLDDDCDASTDEDFASQTTNCGVGACAQTGATSCGNGTVGDSCTPGTPAANDVTCNGVDDDCNGTPDEDFTTQTTACGVGACAQSGLTTCVNGELGDSCVPGTPAANDATCNSIDEDCSGIADEDFVSTATNCGIGACAQTGATSCANGSVNDSCTPGTPAPNDTTCNAIDDDCNGTADEDFASQATNCGVGACRRTGSTSCVSGSVLDSCSPGTPAADDATCNGIDEDCNGTADEDFVSTPISCGVGACTRTGSTQCVSGQFRTDCTPGTPASNDATCDSIDDDCDGSIDEDGACLNSFLDADGDGFGNPASGLVECCGPGPGRVSNNLDCDDANPAVWSVPGEALQLRVSGSTVTWIAPLSAGGTAASLRYDTLRSSNPADFVGAAVCVESGGSDTVTVDTLVPAPASVAALLVRARNTCAGGVGTLGVTSSGAERSGRECP